MDPNTLAIYYGWPSTVNGAYSVPNAVNVFKEYDMVIFGAGLENPSHEDHLNVYNIINHQDMNSTEVYGYVSMTIPCEEHIRNKIDQWHDMGVSGIFCDEFGYDYDVTRTTQNNIVEYIHGKQNPSLTAFVNAWNPDDVFSNTIDPLHNPCSLTHKLNPTDWYLAESFAVMNNAYDNTDSDNDGVLDWEVKANKLANEYNGQALIAAVATTGSSNNGFVQEMADYSYYISSMYSFDAWGWGEKDFSSAGGLDSLPFRTRKQLPEGDKLHGNIVVNGDIIEVNTNVGFHINKLTNTVSNRLN